MANSQFVVVAVLLLLSMSTSMVVADQALLADEFTTYSAQGITFSPTGTGVTLSLLNNGASASAMGSTGAWLYGSFGAWVKLPGGNAAGTVATLYMSSPFPQQCEFDFEFLGHVAGGLRKIHTNVFVDGKGGREQQILMPGNFDPTAAYHYYHFEWHQDQVVFYVDGNPIRQFKNLKGIINNGTYCDHKAMSLYLSIWDGSQWATEGGSIKIDWSAAPFSCEYTNFNLDGCAVSDPSGIAACQAGTHASGPQLTPAQIQYMQTIKGNATLVKYNYCTDHSAEYPECSYNAM